MSFEMRDNFEEIHNRKEKIEIEVSEFKDNVVEKFSQEDQEKIFKALDFMLKIHLPQKDRVDGLPFASHPLNVAKKVMEFDNNADLVVSALMHDSVEDQSERIFIERTKRKKMIPESVSLKMTTEVKEKYKDILKSWSFQEIKDLFGSNVEFCVKNVTNTDYNSLAEDLNLSEEVKRDFINKMYAEHVEDLIKNTQLFTLKLADLSTNIDLRSLDPKGYKHQKLKRKYKSVIETVLKKIETLSPDHALYASKDKISENLNEVYKEQYS